MSRRLLALVSICCVAALSASAVAYAHHGGGDDSGGHHGKRFKRHAGSPGKFLGGGMFGAGLNDVAQRLGVDPSDLRAAVKAVAEEQRQKKLEAAGLTPDEIATLKACGWHHGWVRRAHHDRGDCDTAALTSAVEKLRAAPKAKPDLTALKNEVAASLAAKLGKTPDEVIAAARAVLDERLTKAVAAGWLTQQGHDIALACFDDPSSCDFRARRAEIRWFGKRHGERARHAHA